MTVHSVETRKMSSDPIFRENGAMLMSQTDRWQSPPHTWGQAVYGVMFNHRPALMALGDAVHQPPHHAPPKGPVLYIKPRNSHTGDGEVTVPHGVFELELGATLALVMGQTVKQVAVETALSHVAGYLAVADVRMPHNQYYRPQVPAIARDGFCPMARRFTPASEGLNPDALTIRVWVNDQLVQTTHTGDRIRQAAQLLSDVSSFMSLQTGDLLLMGVSHGAPRVRVGDTSRIEIDGLEPLRNHFVADPFVS